MFGAVCVAVGGLTAGPQSPPATSVAKATEVVALMQAKKLETIAARDSSQPGRFVAALLVPNVQLLTVSAAYAKPTDIEYSLSNKLFQNAYLDLNAGVLSSDRFFVDDALGNGLVARPRKNAQPDAVDVNRVKQVFDGDFVDPKKKNSTKLAEDVYMKAFAEADARYTRALDILIAELKKAPPVLAGPGLLR